MIDWDGNGKIDPVDVGIFIAAEEQSEENSDDEEYTKMPKRSAGCFTSVILVIGVVIGIVGIGGKIFNG